MDGRAVQVALAAFVALIVFQRVAELLQSARHARRLRARGGHEVRTRHFPLFVLLHAGYPLALIAEVTFLGAGPTPLAGLWLLLWLGAQALRLAAIRALGDRWNVRIWVLPGAPRVRRGPYRFLAHPNYVAVAVELLAGPLIFGAWRTALLCSAVNAVALAIRIRAEDRALDQAERAAPADPQAARAS